jgi:hypothetical protein
MRLRLTKVMLMDRSVRGEEPLVVFNSNVPSNFKICEQKRGPSEKRDGSCYVLANNCWEMLLKAVG